VIVTSTLVIGTGKGCGSTPVQLPFGQPATFQRSAAGASPDDERAPRIEAGVTQIAGITARSQGALPVKRCQNVPDKVAEMPLVVSVTVTSVKTTVIGGVQSGWNVAVSVSSKFAFPFCTGKSPSAETLALLAAFG
jgi:hypothetical protein